MIGRPSCAAVTSSVGAIRKVPSPRNAVIRAAGSGCGHPDPHRGRDLVAHAGEAELQVAGPAAGGVPHLLQVTGRAAGGGDDDVAGPGVLLQDADDLALGEHRVGGGDDVGIGWHRGLVEQLVRVRARRPARSPRRRSSSSTRARQAAVGVRCPRGRRRRSGRPGPAWRRRRCRWRRAGPRRATLTLMLANRTSGLAKMRVRAGGEVGQPRADGEHQVGLAGQGVGGRGALQADAADLPPRRAAARRPCRRRSRRPGAPTAAASCSSSAVASE